MPRGPIPPYPKNAPGPFCVENECCIACEAPEAEAPDLMDHDTADERGTSYHCYFKKQPTTPEETERAILACVVSCCDAVRYGGNDPEVLARFRGHGAELSCDALSPPDPLPSEEQPRPTTIAEQRRAIRNREHPLWDRELDG